MPVSDFSAAVKISPILKALRQVWSEDILDDELIAPGVSFRVLAENHGMRAQQLIGEPCVQVKAWWTQDCDYDPTYNSTTFDATIGCEIPAGKDDGSEFVNYVPNMYVHDTRGFEDQECTNELFAVNRSADRINAAIKAIRHGLFDNAAAHLVANAKVNSYTEPGYGTIAGTKTTFTAAEFGNLELLHTLELIAMKNKLGNRGQYWTLNAIENFWTQKEVARWGSENRDPGDTARVRSRGNMVWDLWLNETLGEKATFLINPAYLGMLNFAKYDSVPRRANGHTIGLANAATDKLDVREKSVWSVTDPMYSIRVTDETGATSLRPIIYDIEYVKHCTGRGAQGYEKYRHDFFVNFSGGIYAAPANICGGQTGILHFEQV